MNNDFQDIRERIKENPTWWDCNGTPRYGKFHPSMSPNIYAEEIILLEIGCQNCSEKFLVEMNWSMMDKISHSRESFSNRLIQLAKWKSENPKAFEEYMPFHYGDPPFHDDMAGNTMNCEDLEIKEFWARNKQTKHEWKRIKKYEHKNGLLPTGQ